MVMAWTFTNYTVAWAVLGVLALVVLRQPGLAVICGLVAKVWTGQGPSE